MIPDALREFLSAPRWCALGLVDDRGRPHLSRCVGWQLGPPGGPDLRVFLRTSLRRLRPGDGASDTVEVMVEEAFALSPGAGAGERIAGAA